MLCIFMYYYSKTCAKITLCVFSVLTLLFGAFNGYMGYQIYNSDIWKVTDETGSSQRKLAFYFICAVAGATLLTGLFGLATAKWDKCCCIGTFALLSFLISGFFLTLGSLLIYLNYYSTDIVTSFCNKDFVNFNEYVEQAI